MEKKQSEMTAYELEKQCNEKFAPIARKYETGQIGFYQAMQQAYNLDRQSPPVTGTAEERFVIYDKGQPLLSERYEVHIKDRTNEDFTIIVRGDFFGYEEETEKYSTDIINKLNEKRN